MSAKPKTMDFKPRRLSRGCQGCHREGDLVRVGPRELFVKLASAHRSLIIRLELLHCLHPVAIMCPGLDLG